MGFVFTGAALVSLGVSSAILSSMWLLRRAIVAARNSEPTVLRAVVHRNLGIGPSDKARGLLALDPKRARWGGAIALTAGGGVVGFWLAGPAGALAAAGGGFAVPFAVERRRRRRLRERLEEQFAECTETIAMAVRGGLSISQALEFAASDAEEPMGGVLDRVLADRRLGASLDVALRHFPDEVPSAEARLLTLLLATHARSGGNLAKAMDEVASSISERVAVRRELNALTAQGRLSGAILSFLPIAFFVVLAITSGPGFTSVLRSGPGAALLLSGLTLQALAYAWIRRLLRVRL